MTLPRYEAICEHWQRVPPLAVSTWAIAQSLGASKPTAAKKKAGNEEQKSNDRQAFLDMLGGAGFKQVGKPEWLTT